jgi:hypothetical protein
MSWFINNDNPPINIAVTYRIFRAMLNAAG